MRWQFPGIVVLLAMLALLGGCGDFDEMKSEKLYNQAQTLLQQGQEDEAEQVLNRLLATYPETQSFAPAELALKGIHQRREAREKLEFSKILNSYRDVLNGYRSFVGHYPASYSELDESEYFFDTDYLVEIVPEQFQTYLALFPDQSGFSAWCLKEDLERGYYIDDKVRKLVMMSRDEILALLKGRFQHQAQKEHLTLLVPKG
jgi:hypothetical protein